MTIGGRSIGVFNVGGEYYALRNRCPHQGGPLCEGFQFAPLRGRGARRAYRRGDAGAIIRCPWHGWEFDVRTGRSWFDPERTRVRSYRAGSRGRRAGPPTVPRSTPRPTRPGATATTSSWSSTGDRRRRGHVVGRQRPGDEHRRQRPVGVPQPGQPIERRGVVVDAQVDERERARARRSATPPSAVRRPVSPPARSPATSPASSRSASGAAGSLANASRIAGATASETSMFAEHEAVRPAQLRADRPQPRSRVGARPPARVERAELAPVTMPGAGGDRGDGLLRRLAERQPLEQQRAQPRDRSGAGWRRRRAPRRPTARGRRRRCRRS